MSTDDTPNRGARDICHTESLLFLGKFKLKKNIPENFSIAVPWSLSHYIPLNGFHPLYRALFDNPPENITINAWDNIELSQILRGNSELRAEVLNSVSVQREILHRKVKSNLAERYIEGYFPPNIALTSLLPGDIEFHHTAPFPSLTRPFVFHCESFAPIFFPFSHQGEGKIMSPEALRRHYLRILGDPLCLGIFSHIPETLRDISLFFDSRDIDEKLHQTRIGLSEQSLPSEVPEKRWPLTTPHFLFVNSANQNSANFFHRGGHVVLRFWRELRTLGYQGKLYLRCVRPSDQLLTEHGVDVAFLHAEEGGSVIWIQEYLTNQELNALMSDVHFFLLPSASLHSVSIMQAMALGTVPVVTDTVGTSLYVEDDHNGIVLEGVLSENWKMDQETGVLVDFYHRSKALDDSLVIQLTRRITALLTTSGIFEALRQNALTSAQTRFSGSSFSDEFWTTVQVLFSEHVGREVRSAAVPSAPIVTLNHCMVEQNEWARIFESVPQPVLRIYTGIGRVSELGGAFIHTVANASMELHNWSVLAEYCNEGAPRLNFAKSVKELGGRYITHPEEVYVESRFRLTIERISRLLMPYPSLHGFAARILKLVKRVVTLAKKRARSEPQNDIQLVREDVSGMNIIRFIDRYYAIPQHEGAFLATKANDGGYSDYFVGNSVKEVLRKIAENEIRSTRGGSAQSQGKASVEMIDEGESISRIKEESRRGANDS